MTAAGVAAQDEAIRAGSKSFALASRLFESATRPLVWDLYAWCRHCDDVTDGQVRGHGHAVVADRAARVAELRRLSDRALGGDGAAGPAFAGLARVVAATRLPGRYVHDHLAGFEMDAAERRYDTLDDTLSYCYHVAGVVGLMMAWIMGVRDQDTLLRGCDLGMGFQLTNIARDVNDDVVNGRIYYASAWYGVSALPWRSAWSVATARHVYADIGAVVRRRGASAWDTRAATGRGQKVGRVVQALGEAAWSVTRRHAVRLPRQGLLTPASTAMGESAS